MEAARRCCDTGDDASGTIERDQGSALARLDRGDAGWAISGDPQALAGCIPGDGEWVQWRRERGDRSAGGAAGKYLPIEDARYPDRLAVAGNAFDQPVPWIDRQHCLRLNGRRSDERKQADQRSAPAISFCSLEWIDPAAATYSPRSNARSDPR